MSDARWLDVEDDVAAASDHFGKAVELHALGGFDDPSLAGYRNGMALMHALQAAHTSAEMALQRVLLILGEQRPDGEDWHQKLIDRASKPTGGASARPAILTPAVARDLDETRRFRNRATRSYGAFDAHRTGPKIEAAKSLATSFASDLGRFRKAIEPD